ncbi:MAG: hypothetical protein HQL88_06375 [Magnetococcales bacterium]|nr:hypothetical protein [Magnetococcales bacterium]
MKELHFRVQTSSDTPHYTVSIHKDDKNISAHCTCEHGGRETLCKHRLAILSGKAKWIISDNAADVKRVLSWVAWSDVGQAITKAVYAQKRLKDAQKELERATALLQDAEAEMSAAQQALIQAMND